jgi:hypothetical protein
MNKFLLISLAGALFASVPAPVRFASLRFAANRLAESRFASLSPPRSGPPRSGPPRADCKMTLEGLCLPSALG